MSGFLLHRKSLFELDGRTMGIVGFGRIGRRLPAERGFRDVRHRLWRAIFSLGLESNRWLSRPCSSDLTLSVCIVP